LLGAMRALRVDHDPDRARTILSQYLAGHPKGALAEEALVMLVEAAVAHGDRDASALAARYFQLYPRGEFAVQVRRALAGTAAAQ
jgi:outer membrane protein assembly factor BamD (BamD/ComL family)